MVRTMHFYYSNSIPQHFGMTLIRQILQLNESENDIRRQRFAYDNEDLSRFNVSQHLMLENTL